jgi:hypothetical protein
VKPKPTHADLAGATDLALQRLARAQKRAAASSAHDVTSGSR